MEGLAFGMSMPLILLSWPSRVGDSCKVLGPGGGGLLCPKAQQPRAAPQTENISIIRPSGMLLAVSRAWPSIVAGRAIPKKGWRWNVGNGSSIDT